MTSYNTSLGINIPEDFDQVFFHAYGVYLEVALNNIDLGVITAINNYVRVQGREQSLEIPDVNEQGLVFDIEDYINIDMNALNTDILNQIMNDYTTASNDPTAIPNISQEAIGYPIAMNLINGSPTTYLSLKDAEPTGLIVPSTRANVGTVLNTLQLAHSDFFY